MRLVPLLFLIFLMLITSVYADDAKLHSTRHEMHSPSVSDSPLTEAGNDAFGTIQEIIKRLNHDPELDWSKVNLEVLRQHLVDMNDMTLNIEVISQQTIEKGVKILVRPTTLRSESALDRVFSVHPAQLKGETGWEMLVQKKEKTYTLTITTGKPDEVSQIKGLGYIGIMASGNHHQAHHWMMAKGENPHHDH